MHYGSDLRHFVDIMPTVVDTDSLWGLPIEADDDASSYKTEEPSEEDNGIHPSSSHRRRKTSTLNGSRDVTPTAQHPLSPDAKAAPLIHATQDLVIRPPNSGMDHKIVLKKLRDSAAAIIAYHAFEIAEEITRVMATAFLSIEASCLPITQICCLTACIATRVDSSRFD